MFGRALFLSVIALCLGSVTALATADPAHPPNSYEQPDQAFDEHVEGASRLEGRLLAPCCWDSSRQTLDVHGSPVADQLRREIRARLRTGETPEAIEADLIERYSTKILAVPPGNPLKEVGIVLSVAVVLAGAGIASMLYRWKRRPGRKDADVLPKGERDRWDDKLEQELAKID